MLAYLDAPTLGQPEVFIKHAPDLFDADGNIGIDSTRTFLKTFVERYEDWVKRHVSK